MIGTYSLMLVRLGRFNESIDTRLVGMLIKKQFSFCQLAASRDVLRLSRQTDLWQSIYKAEENDFLHHFALDVSKEDVETK